MFPNVTFVQKQLIEQLTSQQQLVEEKFESLNLDGLHLIGSKGQMVQRALILSDQNEKQLAQAKKILGLAKNSKREIPSLETSPKEPKIHAINEIPTVRAVLNQFLPQLVSNISGCGGDDFQPYSGGSSDQNAVWNYALAQAQIIRALPQKPDQSSKLEEFMRDFLQRFMQSPEFSLNAAFNQFLNKCEQMVLLGLKHSQVQKFNLGNGFGLWKPGAGFGQFVARNFQQTGVEQFRDTVKDKFFMKVMLSHDDMRSEQPACAGLQFSTQNSSEEQKEWELRQFQLLQNPKLSVSKLFPSVKWQILQIPFLCELWGCSLMVSDKCDWDDCTPQLFTQNTVLTYEDDDDIKYVDPLQLQQKPEGIELQQICKVMVAVGDDARNIGEDVYDKADDYVKCCYEHFEQQETKLEKQCVIGAVKPVCIYKKVDWMEQNELNQKYNKLEQKELREKEMKMVTGKQILGIAQKNLQTCESYRDVAFVRKFLQENPQVVPKFVEELNSKHVDEFRVEKIEGFLIQDAKEKMEVKPNQIPQIEQNNGGK